ncbi:MAG: hypothetical protein OXD42_14535, partial [Rhodospirillaceae bacterium]|nr:hypothetical protein [Rhodospirillaceae bacterium]
MDAELSIGMPRAPTGAPDRLAVLRPAHDGIDRPVQLLSRQDCDVPRMQLADGRRTPFPRRMQGVAISMQTDNVCAPSPAVASSSTGFPQPLPHGPTGPACVSAC